MIVCKVHLETQGVKLAKHFLHTSSKIMLFSFYLSSWSSFYISAPIEWRQCNNLRIRFILGWIRLWFDWSRRKSWRRSVIDIIVIKTDRYKTQIVTYSFSNYQCLLLRGLCWRWLWGTPGRVWSSVRSPSWFKIHQGPIGGWV